MERIAGSHAAHREKLKRARLTVELRHRFKPIHLRFLAPVVALRHEHFPAAQSELLLAPLHVAPHCRLPYAN
jgi:hypothetical protein